MSAPAAPRSARTALSPPGPARSGCARCSARSAAAPSGWFLRGGCRRASIERMRAPFMDGAFPFPVKYGYATVGRVETARPSCGRHGLRAASAPERCSTSRRTPQCALPDDVPPERARARRQHGDGAQRGVGCGAGPGRPHCRRRRAAWSGSLVALSVRAIAGRRGDRRRHRPGARRARARARRRLCAAAGTRHGTAISCFTPAPAPPGLATALRLAGEEATDRRAELVRRAARSRLPLGGAFHSRRLRLISSQVGQIAPSHRPRWTHRPPARRGARPARRRRLDALLAPAVAFEDLPPRLPAILDARNGVLCQPIRYPERDRERSACSPSKFAITS